MIFPSAILLSVMTFFASVASLLTVTRLWQLKEWRLDRLREHVSKNGWQQFFGWSRPLLTAVLIVMSGFPFFWENGGILFGVFILAAVSLLQVILSPHRPVWTAKAKMIVLLSSALIVCSSAAVSVLTDLLPAWNKFSAILHFGLPLLTPLFVFVSWVILAPVDRYLKWKILAATERLRLSHPHLTVIGITGSVGKTTMKGLLEHLLKQKGAIATPERVNSEIGVARWLTSTLRNEPEDSKKIIIVEMGAYRIGEIALLCKIARPTIGIITAIGTQHLSLFGGKENIIQAKGELFEALPETGIAFGNSDNPVFTSLKSRAKCKVMGVGTDHHADIQIFDIEETGDGVKFKVCDTAMYSKLAGTHSVTGISMAVAVAKHLGVSPKESAKLLPSFQRMEGTFEVKSVNGVFVLDDSYNSSPESVMAAIRWAATRPEKKKVLLLEGIIELGDQEEILHREIAEEAAKVFDTVFVAHARSLPYFQDALGNRVLQAASAGPAESGSLLVICGRVSASLHRRFLPSS